MTEAPVIKRGQKIEISDGYYTIEGTAKRDVYDTAGMIFVDDDEDGAPLKVRGDLAISIIVDGIEILANA